MTTGDIAILIWVIVTVRVTVLLVRLIAAKANEENECTWNACLHPSGSGK